MCFKMNLKIIMINLDSVLKRMNWQRRQLELLNIPYHRYSGLSESAAFKLFSKKFERSLLESEENGCWGSHINLWHQLLNESDEVFYIILEDDVLIPHDFMYQIQVVISSAPQHWEVIYLAGVPKRGFEYHSSLDNTFRRRLVTYKRVPHTTGAYVVNKKGAAKLVELEVFDQPVDVAIADLNNRGLSILGVYPPIVIRDYIDDPDRYNSTRHKRNRSLFWKIKKILKKLFRKIYLTL